MADKHSPGAAGIEKIAAIGFLLTIGAAVALDLVTSRLLDQVSEARSKALEVSHFLVEAERVRFLLADRVVSGRAYMLTEDPEALARYEEKARISEEAIAALMAQVTTAEGKRLVEKVHAVATEHEAAVRDLLGRQERGAAARVVIAEFRKEINPRWAALDGALHEMTAYKQRLVDESAAEADRLAARSKTLSAASTGIFVVIGGALALVLLRRIRALVLRDAAARQSAEALAKELGDQSQEVAAALHDMRDQRDRAEARVSELERRDGGTR